VAESQTADLALMRGLNERVVLDRIREDGPISRAELARRSNLSRSTVSSIITSLLAADLVREVGIGHSLGGRRPIMLEYNYQSSYVIGVELATTALTVLLTDQQATVLQRVRRPFDLAAGPGECIPQVAALINKVLTKAGLSLERISGVGVGVPGPLSEEGSRLVAPPVMPGWDNVALRQLLEEALGLRVFLENDANLGALAEHRWGAARGHRNVAYIYLGTTGIGSGLILDDRLYRGDVGSAGEIGHLTLDGDGPACRCGSYGCLETLASTQALLECSRSMGLWVDTIEELVVLAHKRDVRAVAVVRQAGEYLGVAVASLLNLLNPARVVLGGTLAEAGDLLLDPLRATLHRRGLTVASEHVDIVAGNLGDDVVAIGAVSIVVQNIFHTPPLARQINRAGYGPSRHVATAS
jgi:predicted NBD/HSP70 family sugar kinase